MIIDSGVVTGSLTVSGSFNQQGNAFISGNLIVSGVVNAIISGSIDSASYAAFASTATSASFASTARSSSFALNATSSSYALVSTSGSYALTATSASQASNANTATTSSFALNATSASYALTATSASQASNANTATSASYALNATNALTASYFVTSSVTSASFALNATSASQASNANTATSASQALNANTATSASYALAATSSSYAVNASTATSASQAANAVTSSYAANADLLDGIDSTRFAVTSSNSFTGTQYVSATNNATSFTSTASIYTDGGLRVTKDAYVSGTIFVNNLTVYGTQSVNYITSSQLNISTNIITVNTDVPSIRFGGLAVYDSGSTRLTGSMLWDSEDNHWVYSNPSGSSYDGGMMLSGPRNSSGLGNEQGVNNNAILKGQGGDHVTSSLITETGTATTFYTNSLYVTSSGNVGIGTTSPGDKLEVSGNVYANAFNAIGSLARYNSTGGIAIAGIAGAAYAYISAYSDGAGTGKALALQKDGGNVLIGTTTDSGYKLYVNGTAFINGAVATSSNYQMYSGQSIQSLNNGTITIALGAAGWTVNGTLGVTGAATFLSSVTGTTASFSSSSSGADLEILKLANNGLGANTQAKIQFAAASTNYASISGGYGATAPQITYAVPNGNHIFTGNNVGIGTTSPVYKLSVSSSSNGDGIYYTDGTVGTWLGSLSSVATVGATTNHPLAFYTNGGERMRITAAGNVGIGTTSPSYLLDVNGIGRFSGGYQTPVAIFERNADYGQVITLGRKDVSASAGIGYPADGVISFLTSATERARIDSNGNFGLGTSSPGGTYGKLTVAGGIRILDDNNAKLEIGRYSAGASNSYIKLGANSNSLRFTNAGDLADIMELTNAGNLGLGVTPSAWGGGRKALQVGTATSLFDDASGSAILSANAFYDGSVYKYLVGTGASAYIQSNGSHVWYSAPSGTAGNAISFTQAMTLASSGNLLLGTTSDSGFKLNLVSSSAAIASFTGTTNGYIDISDGTVTSRIQNSGGLFIGTVNSYDLNLRTNATTRLTIAASTGAATFSNSVTGTQGVNVGANALGTDRMFQVSGTAFTSGASQFGAVINPTMGTLTTLYGIYVGTNCTSATNSYAIYVEGSGGTVTNKYGIYQSGGSDKNYFAGNVGIGTTSPSAFLDISSGTSTDIFRFGASSRWGFRRENNDNRYVSFYRGLSSTPSAVWTVDGDNGNVGIGVTSPLRTLHVLSGVGTAQIQSSGTSSHMYFGDANSSSIDNQGIGSAGNSLWFSAGGFERMRITSGGQILMGTTSAQSGARLQVAGGFLDVWSSANTLLRLNHDGTRGVIETFTGGAYSPTSINPNGGNVLIGTTTDSGYKLDVVGQARFSGTSSILWLENTTATTGKTWRFSSSSNGNLYITQNGVVDALTFTVGTGAATFSNLITVSGNIQTDGNPNRYIKSTGFISNQLGQLSDFGGSDAGYYFVAGGGIQFVSGGANRMLINSSGNVGIGTTSPSNKLTIQSNSTQLRLETASDPSGYYSFIESNYNAANPLNIYSSGAASYAMGTISLVGITGVNTYLNSYYGIIFGTSASSISSGTVRGMITNGGNWLIGTTTDSGEKLVVNGSLKVGQGSGGSGTATQSVFQDTYGGVRSAIYVRNTADYATNRGSGYSIQNGNGVEKAYMQIYANDATQTGYTLGIGVNGGGGLTIASTGAATFSSSVTATSLLTTSMSGSAINIRGDETLNSNFGITWTTPSYPGGISAIRVARRGASDAADMMFFTAPNGDIPNERMRITSGGNVGIGTTSPGTQLQIDAATSPTIRFNASGASGGAGSIQFYNQGTQKWNLTTIATSNDLALYNNGGTSSYNIYIPWASGNVLIGTTTDSGQKLQVVGSAYINSNGGSDSYPLVVRNALLKANNNYLGIKLASADASSLDGNIVLFGGSSKRLEIAAYDNGVGPANVVIPYGNFGIGTTDPSNYQLGGKFVVAGATSGFYFNDSSNRLVLDGAGTTRDLTFYFRYSNSATIASDSSLIFSTGGTPTERMRILSGGNIGINNTGLGNVKLYITGGDTTSSNFGILIRDSASSDTMWVRNDGAGYLKAAAWTYGSDIRMKENIYDVTDGIDLVNKLKPKHFDYIRGVKNNLGFIAQEVQQILPQAVSITGEDGMLGLKTDFLVPILVKAVQEEDEKIVVLQKKVASLEAEIETLKNK